jgi:diadenosine tetraphosphate (Ap4A) HIT family hydrolase
LAARERNPNGHQMTNATMLKFGYPATLVREFEHWAVLVRPAQVTLGSLVLASTSDATAYSALPDGAFAEQGDAIHAIESALGEFCGYERINYLMLMMVDREVHFHVIPRYSGVRRWEGIEFPDRGWPGPPQLKIVIELDGAQISSMALELKRFF